MKKRIAFLLVLALMSIQLPVMAASKIYYVSPTGSDSNNGTTEATAFATLEKARDILITRGHTSGDFEVRILGGTYNLTSTFNLPAVNSGNASKTVKYVGYGDTRPLFKSSVTVPASAFETPTDSTILALLPESSKANIKAINLVEYGIANNTLPYYSSSAPTVEPYVNGEALTLAQYPNKGEGYLSIGTVTKDGSYQTTTFSDSRVGEFTDIGRIYGYGSWSNYFFGASIKVKSIDATAGTLGFESYTSGTLKQGQQYILYNVVEDLDAPGEYFITDGVMYFYPEAGTEEVEFAVPTGTTLIYMKDCGYTTFENIDFTMVGGTVFDIDGGSNVTIKNCNFSHLGTEAINMKDSTDSTVTGGEIYDCGMSGITIEAGEKDTLTHANDVIDGVVLHDCSRRAVHNTAAVRMDGSGITLKNSKIYNMPHFGVRMDGAENTIEHNEIFNVCNMSYDCGAIYNHGDLSYAGNVYESNYFHDITGRNGNGTMCIYFDNVSSGAVVKGNIFAYCDEGVIANGSSGVTIKSNIFFNTDTSLRIPTISATTSNMTTFIKKVANFINVGDVSSLSSITAENLPAAEEIVFTVDAWNKPEYQYLLQIIRGYKNGDSACLDPDNNLIEGNVIYNSPVFNLSAEAKANATITDNVHKEAVMYK